MIAGKESAPAVHLTWLNGHKPVDAGQVLITLSGGGLPDESFSVELPAQAGIFRPIVKPSMAAKREVTLSFNDQLIMESYALGQLEVFATADAASHAPGAAEEGGEPISFSLEQQWKVPFAVAQANPRMIRPNLPAFATVTAPPEREALIIAPRAGRISAASSGFPLVGQRLTVGAPLLRISAGPQEGADPASLNAAIEQAQIQLQAAEREVNRLTPLAAQGIVAQRRLDEATTSLQQAQAALRSARRRQAALTQVQSVKAQGDLLTLPSPTAGVLAQLDVSAGAWVNEGQVLGRIIDTSSLWLEVSLPQAYLPKLKAASGVWFSPGEGSPSVSLGPDALVSVGVEIDPKTQTLPVRFRLDNPDHHYVINQSFQAHLITAPPRRAVAVPADAVLDDQGIAVVFVQVDGESFERRVVRLGVQDGDYVEIIDGLEASAWVVSKGAYLVKIASVSTESIGHGHAH